jgi:hypothetical protein
MTGSKSNLRTNVVEHPDVIMRDDDADEQVTKNLVIS